MAVSMSLSARRLDKQAVTREMSSSNVAMMVAGDEQTGTAWSSCWMSPWFLRHCSRTFDAVNTKSSTSSYNASHTSCKISDKHRSTEWVSSVSTTVYDPRLRTMSKCQHRSVASAHSVVGRVSWEGVVMVWYGLTSHSTHYRSFWRWKEKVYNTRLLVMCLFTTSTNQQNMPHHSSRVKVNKFPLHM